MAGATQRDRRRDRRGGGHLPARARVRLSEQRARRFSIRLDPRFRLALLLFGVVGARNAYATLEADELRARFGFFAVATPLGNVERWEIGGPYRWWRAIGVRGTVGQPEMTFGGSAHGGICLALRRQVPLWWWPWHLSRLYLTLDDLEGFAALLEAHGIPGPDA